jgi:hypothetical protein
MLAGKSGKRGASGRCRSASQGSGALPGDAGRQVREAGRFREMPVGKSGKRGASGRCRSASRGSGALPGDASRQVGEAGRFREMPVGKSGKRGASGRCRSASQGSGALPGDAGRQVGEAGRFREMPVGKSGKRSASGRCRPASWMRATRVGLDRHVFVMMNTCRSVTAKISAGRGAPPQHEWRSSGKRRTISNYKKLFSVVCPFRKNRGWRGRLH